MYEKSKSKALEILLKCEKNKAGIKMFLPKLFKKDINENQKIVFLKAIRLFDIRNEIFSLFRNGFIKPLDYQKAKKSAETIAERTKLRRQMLDENDKLKKKR